MTLLIKNGTIVTATDQYKGDVFVDGEKITTIGTSLTMTADRTMSSVGAAAEMRFAVQCGLSCPLPLGNDLDRRCCLFRTTAPRS